MVGNSKELILLASKVVSNAGEEYNGRWCFFAGFAFVLNGVEKRTSDIDILTKDHETYGYMSQLLRRIGLRSIATTRDFSSFKAGTIEQETPKDLTLDLLCIDSEWLTPINGMWTKLENIRVGGTSFLVPNPAHLILLKMQVNSHRQRNDSKKQQDLADVQRLMSIRGISQEKIIAEAKRQKLEVLAREFLTKTSKSSGKGDID